MAEGWSADSVGGILAAAFQNTPWSLDHLWAKLHVGAPGAAGTSNPAAQTTRVDAAGCFGATITPPTIANDAVIGDWPAATTAETPTHVSFWSAATGGIFLFSCQITANAIAIGDPFRVPVGDASFTIPQAA